MTMHPARLMPFDELAAGLESACFGGLVRRTERDGATLYCYSQTCVYDRVWTPITTLARGLILDHAARKVVATPFPKFFNVGENITSIPDLPFETFEKLDGSLIIIYWHRDCWKCATKGSLDSEQARWAQGQLQRANLLHLQPGYTYLCEAIYADNRIVVQYPYAGLVLLGAYNEAGLEIAYPSLRSIAHDIGWRVAQRYEYQHVSELVAKTKTLSAQEEGFVLRFSNGLRLKLKGESYCAVHRLISGCTPLALWEAMLTGTNLDAMRKQLPEEFWPDFDKIVGILGMRLATLLHQIDTAAASIAWDQDVTDKDIGLTLRARFPGPWADFVFHRRKKGSCLPPVSADGKVPSIRRAVFNEVRPVGNRLEGYEPSAAVNRIQDDNES